MLVFEYSYILMQAAGQIRSGVPAYKNQQDKYVFRSAVVFGTEIIHQRM